MEFDHIPPEPMHDSARRGFTILTSARTTAASFIILHDTDSVGHSDEINQDLLRAALVFAAAGIDSMVKQLIEDALPTVIAENEGARAKLEDFIDRRLRREDQSGMKLVAAALAATDSRAILVDTLVRELRSNSLQSVEELSRAVAFFDIPTAEVISDPARLGAVFKARNQIAHEMDVDFTQESGHRLPRDRDTFVEHVNLLFLTARSVLGAVDERLQTTNSDL